MGRSEASRPVDDRLRWRRALFFHSSFFPIPRPASEQVQHGPSMREGCPPTKICQHRFSGLHNTWFTHRDASAGFIYSLPGSFPLKQCTDQYVALFFFPGRSVARHA